MKNRGLKEISTLALVLGMALHGVAAQAAAKPDTAAARTVEVQQIRNATMKIRYAGKTFLVDPMLAAKGAYPGFPGTVHSELRNPLIDLPIPLSEVLAQVDAVIVTHTHLDHWDDAAQRLLPKNLPVFVQHEDDAKLIRGQGFTDVRILDGNAQLGEVRLTHIGGQHGTDAMYAVPELAQGLGQAMGVVFQAPGYKTVYLAGDTVWRPEVDAALTQFRPDVVILNTGYAKLEGFEDSSIIMGKDDVARACRTAPEATVIATHMDAVNHATLSRTALRTFVREQNLQTCARVPADGEQYAF